MVKVSADSYSNVIRIASHFSYDEPDQQFDFVLVGTLPNQA